MDQSVWVSTGMSLTTGRALLLAACTLVGCGSQASRMGMGESDVVTFSDRLEQDSPVIVDNWQARVMKVGCTNVERRSENLVVARCGGVKIAFVKQGLEITIGCKSVTLADCRQLANEIVSAGKATPQPGSGDDVVIVMTKQIPSPKVGGELVARWAKAAENAGCKPTVTKPDIAIYECSEGKAGALIKTTNGAHWFGLGCFSMQKTKCEALHKRIIEEGAGGKAPDEGTTF